MRACRFILRTLTHSATAAPELSITLHIVCDGHGVSDVFFMLLPRSPSRRLRLASQLFNPHPRIPTPTLS